MTPTPNSAPGSVPLRDVSDTALWVAAYRAEESERPDALFRDPYARRLAGERGFAVLSAMPKGRAYAWPLVARTVAFDRFVSERVAAGVDLVVNLAAGLDTRPYRMQLPAELRWVEVDLPRMIEYKSELLAGERPVCRLERVALDLADAEPRRELLARLGSESRQALVLTEGLLIYLPREQVATLARDLAVGALRWWATDLASPGLLQRMHKTWGTAVARADAPFLFAPEEGPAFFAQHGWTPREVVNTFFAAAKMGRIPWYFRPFSWLPEPKKWNPQQVWSGQVLLERM